jgi:hypothetical protein
MQMCPLRLRKFKNFPSPAPQHEGAFRLHGPHHQHQQADADQHGRQHHQPVPGERRQQQQQQQRPPAQHEPQHDAYCAQWCALHLKIPGGDTQAV